MVNEDAFIKFARSRGFKYTWPEQVNKMRYRLVEMKRGFPGIKNNHLTLLEFKRIKEGEWFILDPYVELGPGICDDAPMMLKNLGNSKYYIEGIGYGLDRKDPDRTKFRWQDTIELPPIDKNFLVYRVDVRPDLNGGPGYYYFFKSYRDFRE